MSETLKSLLVTKIVFTSAIEAFKTELCVMVCGVVLLACSYIDTGLSEEHATEIIFSIYAFLYCLLNCYFSSSECVASSDTFVINN
jgi:hypothetical protein